MPSFPFLQVFLTQSSGVRRMSEGGSPLGWHSFNLTLFLIKSQRFQASLNLGDELGQNLSIYSDLFDVEWAEKG